MTFEIEVNGRARSVSVERLPDVADAPPSSAPPSSASPSGANPSGANPSGANPSGADVAGASTSDATPSPAGSSSAGASSVRGSSAAQRFRVTVDGTPHLVDVVRVDGGAVSLILADGRQSYHVAITETAPGDLTLSLADGLVRAVVNGRRARGGGESPGPAGEQRIVAPMPGKVLRVLVEPGDEVAVRQPLVVVEAMKMENELSSPKAGRVKDVAAVEGQSVEAGRLLVVVE